MRNFIFIISIVSLWFGAFEAEARYSGDLNGDDRVDLADMVFLANAIKAGTDDKLCDINTSGKVDDNDLQTLADIIISGILKEDGGFNAGIGGWDEDGEDYGGSVKAPAFSTRSAEETTFYIKNPKMEGSVDKCSVEFGISKASEYVSAILFNIELPRNLEFDSTSLVELNGSLLNGHILYGKPKISESDNSSCKFLRFIVFSSDLAPLNDKEGSLGHIFYSYKDGNVSDSAIFSDCQILTSENKEVVTLPFHQSWGILWDAEVDGIAADESLCDIYDLSGTLLRKGIETKDLELLEKGLYIILQGSKRTKFLR